ncbi:hypothetical protein CXG81DRAFT_28744 [Caulochytrium protostelioides]|uniref:Co-chaperone HscB C-terminal oligomerisation domain-containing protein n=1 Tax=Caulochytrium protostelioides TaxID=1555241 RepID=A0A4P9X0D9_9FUNG|nr:hypothetical protein CXG81DRAFT_28744 [Caulochytrium protostelioides]|eukprot:RKO98422.1 hypothetical protein CXG81DRAFT_28744 [Caulochytrium protostelioides]
MLSHSAPRHGAAVRRLSGIWRGRPTPASGALRGIATRATRGGSPASTTRAAAPLPPPWASRHLWAFVDVAPASRAFGVRASPDAAPSPSPAASSATQASAPSSAHGGVDADAGAAAAAATAAHAGATRPCHACAAATPRSEPFCVQCDALQSFPGALSPFELCGAPPRAYPLDQAAAVTRYRAYQRRLHPDKYAQASAAAQQHSIAWSTAMNVALDTLRDPHQRSCAALHAAVPGAADAAIAETAHTAADPALLDEVFEVTDAAEACDDDRQLAALVAMNQRRIDESLRQVQAALDAQPVDVDAAVGAITALKYWSSLHTTLTDKITAASST